MAQVESNSAVRVALIISFTLVALVLGPFVLCGSSCMGMTCLGASLEEQHGG